MAKFTDVVSNIEGAFAQTDWSDEGINTLPDNYQGPTNGEFVQLHILPVGTGIRTFSDLDTLSGQLIVRIFVSAGDGTRRTFEIADLLDSLLAGKSFSETQMGIGTLQSIGIDPENLSLFQAQYSINFNHTQ